MGLTGRRLALLAAAIVLTGSAALAVVLARAGDDHAGPHDRGARARIAGAYPELRALPAASLFVRPDGHDAGPCTRAKPCRSFDRAYHVATPGKVVELAGGSYGQQTITPDPRKRGRGCESRLRVAACVVLRPAAGARVVVGDLDIGGDYSRAGPAGIAIVAGDGHVLQTASTNLNQAREVALWGVRQRNLYVTGGVDMAIQGGEVGPSTTPDGNHPEIQRVYASAPLLVPRRLTFEGILFHDINTTSPTAHVDCLQVENGDGIVIRANRFERCGSVGLRMSYGADGNEAPPSHVLVENNVFGPCADTPVSPCYYSAQVGVGRDVLVRNNTALQAFQPAGGARYAHDVHYVGNVAPGVQCEDSATYSRNVWTRGRCSATDRRVRTLRLDASGRPTARSPALLAGDPRDHPATDIAGRRRPARGAPDAGAYQVSR